jgi:hypothetical protein
MIPSTATVRFGPDGAPQVDASLRLTGSSQINCFTYPGKPPILAIDDAHVQVSITVPASGTVTPADLAAAHRLAAAVAAYITGLQDRLPAADDRAA